MCGGNPKHWAYGFHNWSNGEVMHEYMGEGVKGRFLGFWSIMIYAAFSIAGPDFIALSAAEMKNPRRNIPRCARATFLRIFIFYVLGSLAVGILCDSEDPRLLAALGDSSVGSAASPWVIGIENLGIHGLAGFINVLILISGWSCGNAMLYSSSRTLYSLAMSGHAPRIFLKCTETGNPIYCVVAVSLISCITFLVASTDGATVFGWFVGLSTCGFVLSYTAMHITYIGWYRALKAQGISRDTLHWKAPFMPYGAYIGTVFGVSFFCFWDLTPSSPFQFLGSSRATLELLIWLSFTHSGRFSSATSLSRQEKLTCGVVKKQLISSAVNGRVRLRMAGRTCCSAFGPQCGDFPVAEARCNLVTFHHLIKICLLYVHLSPSA